MSRVWSFTNPVEANVTPQQSSKIDQYAINITERYARWIKYIVIVSNAKFKPCCTFEFWENTNSTTQAKFMLAYIIVRSLGDILGVPD